MGRYAAKNKKYAAFGGTPAFPGPVYAKIQRACGFGRLGGSFYEWPHGGASYASRHIASACPALAPKCTCYFDANPYHRFS
jgi:hypothetical protein